MNLLFLSHLVLVVEASLVIFISVDSVQIQEEVIIKYHSTHRQSDKQNDSHQAFSHKNNYNRQHFSHQEHSYQVYSDEDDYNVEKQKQRREINTGNRFAVNEIDDPTFQIGYLVFIHCRIKMEQIYLFMLKKKKKNYQQKINLSNNGPRALNTN